MKEKIIQNTVLRFILVGVINTLVGTAIMFGLYNLAHCSYWVSSASNYILTSIFELFPEQILHFSEQGKEHWAGCTICGEYCSMLSAGIWYRKTVVSLFVERCSSFGA